jgi:Na+/H+-translocating membrane pyrophosphatase
MSSHRSGSTRWLLYTDQAPTTWLHFALCGLVGIITTHLFVWITQYYIDYKYEPVVTHYFRLPYYH